MVLGTGGQHGTLKLVPKRVPQWRVADVTMSMLQEQQCILEEVLLNPSAQPSTSPVSMTTSASSAGAMLHLLLCM